jgi:hypothetical protein
VRQINVVDAKNTLLNIPINSIFFHGDALVISSANLNEVILPVKRQAVKLSDRAIVRFGARQKKIT